MSSLTIRYLALSISVITLTAIPTVAASAKMKMRSATHPRTHQAAQRHPGQGFGDQRRRAADQSWRAPAQSGAVCPGNARSFDCRIWPPPFDDDPDRKMSGTDGG